MAVPHRYADYRELLDNPDVEAVYLATSPDGRLQQVLDALSAGKHVLVQKPHAIPRPRNFGDGDSSTGSRENAPILLLYAAFPKQPKNSARSAERCNRRPISRPRLWEIQFYPRL